MTVANKTQVTVDRDQTYAEITHDTTKKLSQGCRLYMHVQRSRTKALEMWEPLPDLTTAMVRALEAAIFYKAPIYVMRINGATLKLEHLEDRILQVVLPLCKDQRERSKKLREVQKLCAAALVLAPQAEEGQDVIAK